MQTKTRSFTYLLPGLTDEVSIETKTIKNLWLGVENINTTFDGNVYCEYPPNHVETNQNNCYYIQEYQFKENTFVCYKYPYEDIYDHFINSKYSKFSNNYKNRILKYHNLSYSSAQSSILFKSELLKRKLEELLDVKLSDNSELGEQIIFENECYKFKTKIE
jgi:hypothetical protein